MKKIVYTFLLLFIIGVVGTLVSVSASGGFSFDTYNVNDKVVVDNKEITDIEVNLSSTDLTVHPTSDEQISVELNGKISKKLKKKLKLSAIEKGHTLKIGLQSEDQIKFNIGVLIVDTNVDLYLPEKLYNSIKMEIVSGDIELNSMKAKAVKLKTISGDIIASDIESDHSTFNTISGDIKLSNLIGNINTDTTSGDISIHNENITGNISANTISGDVKLAFDNQPTSLAIDFNAISGEGKVTLSGVLYEEKSKNEIRGMIGTGKYKLKVKTTSGDFYLK